MGFISICFENLNFRNPSEFKYLKKQLYTYSTQKYLSRQINYSYRNFNQQRPSPFLLQVVSLLDAFPKLKFLDLSQNLLMFSQSSVNHAAQRDVTGHTGLTTLVLNSTKITWAMLKDLLVILPKYATQCGVYIQ